MGGTGRVAWAIGVAWAMWAGAAQPDAEEAPGVDLSRTLVVDAVRLVGGKEVAGRSDLSVTHGAFTYHFADESSVAAFEADPERYEIQFNGACARMGPLSSGGDARRWWVHDGRIYVFASESCRQTFIEHADRLLERDDRAILPAECEAADARALLDRAVEWMGGPALVQDVRTVVARRAVAYEDANTRMDHHLMLALEFVPTGEVSRALRQDDWHQYGAWGEVLAGASSWSVARDGAEGPVTWTPLVASQRRSLERQIGAELFVALRGFLAGQATTCRVSAGDIDGTPVEWVAVHQDGVTVRLAIEPGTGRIAAIAFTARGGPSGFIGTRELRFSRFERAGGVLWPVEAAAWFDGQREEPEDVLGVTIEVNGEIDERWFDVATDSG